MLPPVAGAVARPAQVVRNAFHLGLDAAKLHLGVALVAVDSQYIASRCCRLLECWCSGTPRRMNHASSRRPQWYATAILSPCSTCFSGGSATAGAHGRL